MVDSLDWLGVLLAQAGNAARPIPPWLAIAPWVVIGLLFYFTLIRPERRKRAELEQTLDNLKKNDHVITAGGIYGIVVNAPKGAEDITLRVDESNNTRLRVLRSSIARVIKVEESTEPSAESN